jgi:hypothetical protein
MRKLFVFLAAAGAAIVAATPAAAQYYPQGYGYGSNGYGSNGYGYNGYGYNNYGGIRSLQARIDQIQYRIRMLDRRDVIGDRSADRLRDEAGRLESRLHHAERNGLNPYEANEIEQRLARLESEVQYASVNRYGRYDRYGGDRHDGDRDRDHDWDHDRD